MTIIDRFFAILYVCVIVIALIMLIASGFAAGFFTALILGLPLMGLKWILTGRTGSRHDG